ncbi:MAG: glycosyltransferase family 4 protein, partial [Candidatus Acidiferrales bacterium]
VRLLVALTTVFATDWGISMFNRALLRALSSYCEEHNAHAAALALNDPPGRADSRYLSSPRVRLRSFARRKPGFSLAFWREAWARPDLTIIGHVNLLPLAAPLALRGRPFWLIAHGDEAWRRLPALSRWTLARAQTVLAVSDFTRRRLAELNGLAAKDWQVFPNTLDPFSPPAAAAPGNPTAPTLLSVSRLEAGERAAKGLLHALEALPELRRQFPGLRYVVVGDGDDRGWLEARARSLGLGDSVTFTGHLSREELNRCYAACDLFVLPSEKEGFGIVFLEAMAHGKPVVAARAGGAPEVVLDGETGLLVEHGNRDALVGALAALLADPGRRSRLGAAGFRRLQEHFTYELFRQRLFRLLPAGGGRLP